MKILFITKDKNLFIKESDFNKRKAIYMNELRKHNVVFVYQKGINLIFYDINKNKLNFISFFKFLNFEKFDVIITQEPDLNNIILGILKRRFHFRLITQIHGEVFSNNWLKLHFSNIIKFILYSISLLLADKIRTVNKHTNDIIKKKFKKRASLIPIPVVLKYSNKDIQLIKRETLNISFITEFVLIKNPFLICDIIEKFFIQNKLKIIFNIIGDGPLLNKIKNKLIKFKSDNLNIIFHGKVNQKKVISLIKTSKFIIVTSKSESYCRVIIESYLNNTLVFSTKSTGPKELIIDKFFFFDKYRLDELLKKIISLHKNFNKYIFYSYKIKKRYQNYDHNIVTKKWCNFILER